MPLGGRGLLLDEGAVLLGQALRVVVGTLPRVVMLATVAPLPALCGQVTERLRVIICEGLLLIRWHRCRFVRGLVGDAPTTLVDLTQLAKAHLLGMNLHVSYATH